MGFDIYIYSAWDGAPLDVHSGVGGCLCLSVAHHEELQVQVDVGV